MAKEFKDWVNEFVENGADPANVAAWSSEASGGGEESIIAWKPTVDANGNISWTRTSSTVKPTEQNIKGPQGPQGPEGSQGPKGIDGTTYTPKIGTITTIDSTESASASVSINNETKEAVFNFAIPKGNAGKDSVQIDDVNVPSETTVWSSKKTSGKIGELSNKLDEKVDYKVVVEDGRRYVEDIVTQDINTWLPNDNSSILINLKKMNGISYTNFQLLCNKKDSKNWSCIVNGAANELWKIRYIDGVRYIDEIATMNKLGEKQDFRIFKSLEEFNEKKGTSLTVVSGVDNMKDIANAMSEGDMLIIRVAYITTSEIYFGLDTSTGWTKMFTFIKSNGICDVECRTSKPATFKRLLNSDGLIGDWQELTTMDTFITQRIEVPYTIEAEGAITINQVMCGIDGYSLIMCTMEATGGNEVYCYNNMVQGADSISVQLKNTANKKVEATAYFRGLYKKN